MINDGDWLMMVNLLNCFVTWCILHSTLSNVVQIRPALLWNSTRNFLGNANAMVLLLLVVSMSLLVDAYHSEASR